MFLRLRSGRIGVLCASCFVSFGIKSRLRPFLFVLTALNLVYGKLVVLLRENALERKYGLILEFGVCREGVKGLVLCGLRLCLSVRVKRGCLRVCVSVWEHGCLRSCARSEGTCFKQRCGACMLIINLSRLTSNILIPLGMTA